MPPGCNVIHKETQLKDYNKINSSLPASMIDKIILADDTKSIRSTLYKSQQTFPTHTDLKVVKCLVSNPSVGIAEVVIINENIVRHSLHLY